MNSPYSKLSGKIFIGGLALESTQNSLRKYFEKFGEVSDCVLMIDKSNNKSRGFGFVTMKDAFKIDEILKTQPHIIDGKTVDCKIAVPKENMINQTQTQNVEKNEWQSNAEEINGVYNPRKIFVGGLPPLLKEEDMKKYFMQFGELEECIVMHDKISGRPRGFGFVLFKNVESADKVMKEKNSHNLMGKWIDCKRAQPKESLSEIPNNNLNNRQTNSKFVNSKNEPFANGNNVNINSSPYGFKENYPSVPYYQNEFGMEKGVMNQPSYYDRQNMNYSNGIPYNNYPNQYCGNNIMYMNQNNINIYGIPQYQIYPPQYENPYYTYNNTNYYNQINEKNISARTEAYIPNSFQEKNSLFQNSINTLPIKTPQNSFPNITEESINEYMENFKKMRQNVLKNENSSQKESNEKENIASESNVKESNSNNINIPNGGNGAASTSEISYTKTFDTTSASESQTSNNLTNYFKENIGSNTSPFTLNEIETGKKMASVSLSYYFDFNAKNSKNFKLNLFENFPYRFENTEKLKLFNDNEEDNLIYNTAKIIDIKSESEEETNKYQNFFGPHRSNMRKIEREEKRRYKPY